MVNNVRLDLCRELGELLEKQQALKLNLNATPRDVARIQAKIDETRKLLESFDGVRRV